MNTYEKLKKSPEIKESNIGEKIRGKFTYFICVAYPIIIPILIIGLIVGVVLIGSKECSSKHTQLEYEWTTGDSTFVDKIDNIYIYKRYIDGKQFYIYKQTSCCHQIVRETFIPVDGVEKIDSIYFIKEDKK